MRTWRLLSLAAVLTGVMTGTVISADTVKVFRYDGSLQCGMGQAVPLDEMAKELAAVNIKVLSSEKRVVSGLIIALCGAPTGMANVYEIAKDDLPRIPEPTDRESRDFGPGFMLVPQSKSRSMIEACNVKWVAPCHWTKWRRSCVLRRSPYRRKPRRRMEFNTCRCAEHRRAR